MKAIILKEFGGVENLTATEVEKPLIESDEVLVKLSSISINPVDVKTRSGKGIAGLIKDQMPVILGWDIAGVITEIGTDVTDFKIGDEVFAMLAFPKPGKVYAEYVAAKATELALKPANISMDEAAAATLAALTAWQALTHHAKIKAGDRVKLIDGDTTGQVIELIKDNVVIAMGELRTVVKRKRVEKVTRAAVPKELRRSTTSTHTSDVASFSPEIDVRGMRTEDALHAIEKLFDRALMMGFGTLKILHGKGDGILRKMIRQYLKKYDQVDRMEDEHADRGGDGITYVYFK